MDAQIAESDRQVGAVGICLKATGDIDFLTLHYDPTTRIQQIREAVGDDLEAVPLPGSRYLLIGANAKCSAHLENENATKVARLGESISCNDYIAGDAVVIHAELLV